ncbi:MAG: relaxase domain-containing protein [bacterium]
MKKQQINKFHLTFTLAKNAGEPDRRAGADYTFTLAKNASILAIYDDRILKAFEESVKETIYIMEDKNINLN